MGGAIPRSCRLELGDFSPTAGGELVQTHLLLRALKSPVMKKRSELIKRGVRHAWGLRLPTGSPLGRQMLMFVRL